MNKIWILSLLLHAFSLLGNEAEWERYGSHVTSFHADERSAVINVRVVKYPNKAPLISLSISIGDSEYAHSHQSFVQFEEVTAEEIIETFFDKRNLIECRNLSTVGEGWANVELKVSLPRLRELEQSNCKGIIHESGWESWKTIVFPAHSNKALVVNEHGV